jgi:hypothetical protein
VTEIKLIAYNYVFRSTFIFDVLAVFPFVYVSEENAQDLLLIKMLRLYKLKVDFIQEDKILAISKAFTSGENVNREDHIAVENSISNVIKIIR